MHTIVKQLRVEGRVQGVGFRQFMLRTARELGITGWVRNRRDGSVEAVIAGTSEAVHTMLERARHGPPQAMVSDLVIADATGGFAKFEMRATE